MNRPRRRFGQHFLVDATVIQRIMAAIDPQPADHLLEIGPGRGALTRPLLACGASLDLVELDRDLIPGLEALAQGRAGVAIHRADALEFDFAAHAAAGEQLRVVGNLPYNISTPLIFHLLGQIGAIRDMHFMLQREVVERLAAAPGGGAYGRLSVMVQVQCRVEPLFTIPPGAFRPVPKVNSAFVRLTPHHAPPVTIADRAAFTAVVQQAFSYRRKTLRNALAGLLGAEEIRAAGVDPAARAERLDLAAFARLSDRLTGEDRR